MKLSIVIPTYNSEKFLGKTLSSIMEQSYKDYELIIVDGKSIDRTLEVIESFGSIFAGKFKLISEVDKGEPDAINKGMRLSTGDIVTYIDSDDIYESECFQRVNHYFKTHDNMWAYGKCRVIDENGNETRKSVTRFKEIFQPRYCYSTLRMFDYIAQPSVFWRKEVLDTVGYFDINEKLVFDYDYWLRLGYKYKPGYINEYLSCWRSQSKSETAKALKQDIDDALRLSFMYSPNAFWLRPFQYAIYGLAIMGYKRMKAL